MELVGQILKKNRKFKKLTLLNISKELNISEEILNSIENNYFKNDIDNVFIIGHFKSYCSFLNLDHVELLDLFKKEYFPQEINKIEIERPKIKYNVLLSNKVFSLSLIVFIFTTFYFLFVEVDKPSREYAIIPDLPENYIAIIEKANLSNPSNNLKTIDNENIAKLENNVNSSSVIASNPKIEKDKAPFVTLKFLDDTWIQIRDVNEEIIFSQLMNKDDEYSYDLSSNYSITSGNAGHILVLINQKVRGKIGKKGQVVDSFVLNKNFNN